MDKPQGVTFKKDTFVNRSQGKVSDTYDIIKEIGNGSYGTVYQIQHKKSKEFYACKQMAKAKINLEKFNIEIDILIKIDHPNLIKLYEIFEDSRHIFLVMEQCQGGELFDRIINHVNKGTMYTEKEAAGIFKQLMSAICYCHNVGICHRDLKPENILLLSDDDVSAIKIIDFGLSKMGINDKEFIEKGKMKTKVGTAYYVSPEVLQGSYDIKTDIWSAAVILYILWSGEPPFNGSTDNEIYRKILKKQYSFSNPEWKNISEDAKDLIKHMLCEPDKRYSAEETLKHPWLDKLAPNASGALVNWNVESLKNYKNFNKFKKAVLTFIASRLNDKEVENWNEIFNILDKNGDGSITLKEMKDGLSQLKSKNIEWDIESIFNSIDTDESGKIEYTEFLAATMDKKWYLREERLNEAFTMLDKDNSGKISKEEIKKALKLDNIDDSTFEKYIKEYDLNGDGEIDYNEFLNMMNDLNIQS